MSGRQHNMGPRPYQGVPPYQQHPQQHPQQYPYPQSQNAYPYQPQSQRQEYPGHNYPEQSLTHNSSYNQSPYHPHPYPSNYDHTQTAAYAAQTPRPSVPHPSAYPPGLSSAPPPPPPPSPPPPPIAPYYSASNASHSQMQSNGHYGHDSKISSSHFHQSYQQQSWTPTFQLSQPPPNYGAAPRPANPPPPPLPHQFASPHSRPAEGYVQPPNPPPSVYGETGTSGVYSEFRPTGRKRALLIGINYSGKAQLRGCVNDVQCMHYLLLTKFGFKPNDFVIMTDKKNTIKGARQDLPTRANMLAAMKELVAGSKQGDSLVFHYSGHGGSVVDTSGDEDDGFDETILPMDYEKAGPIIDDECHDIMVRHLPYGVRLTAVMDCCHSGTGLDLPFNYDIKYPGSGVSTSSAGAGSSSAVGIALGMFGALAQGGPTGALSHGLKLAVKSRRRKTYQRPEPNPRAGEVVLFSGCADHQTSADTSALAGGTTTGAMTYAFIEAIEHGTGDWHDYSYRKLLHTMRQKLLAVKLEQIPQFSSSHRMDLASPFRI